MLKVNLPPGSVTTDIATGLGDPEGPDYHNTVIFYKDPQGKEQTLSLPPCAVPYDLGY